jgi:hypothetical protein
LEILLEIQTFGFVIFLRDSWKINNKLLNLHQIKVIKNESKTN